METVYIFLADGFEEIEALTPVDVLRRAKVSVKTVGITGKTVKGGQGIEVVADIDGANFVLPQDAAMVVLPGGGLGTQNLAKSDVVTQALQQAKERDLYITAICAAPTVLHAKGLLDGKRATAFPACQAQLVNSKVEGHAVEVDGKLITGRSAGVALQFAHALTRAMCGKETADAVVQELYPEV